MKQLNKRPLVFPVAVVFCSLLFLSGCAKNKSAVNWEEDKPLVNQALVNLGQRQDSTESANREQVEAMQGLIDALGEENQQLKTVVDSLVLRMHQLEEKSRQQQAKADAQLVPAVPVAKPAESEIAETVSAEVPETPAPVAPAVDPAVQAEAEKNAYTAAYLALKSGRFDEALKDFNKQLDLYPQGEYADQAWYWLGESHLALSDGDSAMLAFKYVADHYPESVKHAPSLLKLAQISSMHKQNDKAEQFYSRLVREHPDSSLAEQARRALDQLKSATESEQ